MNRYPHEKTFQSSEEPMENVAALPSLLRQPLAWRRARQLERTRQAGDQRLERIRQADAQYLERTRQAHDQILAWRMQDIFVGRGLTRPYYTIGGGRSLYIPQVVSVTAGPPVGLNIRTLPGQTPDDFAAHAPAIAYNLGVAEVRVVPLGPSRIRLELLRRPG